MKRRSFLIAGGVAGLAGGALLVGAGRLIGDRVGSPEAQAPLADTVPLNAWVRIGADSRVIVALARVEMGQGVSTALPMLVAEELDVPLSLIDTEPAGQDRVYGNRTVFGASWWFHPDNEDHWLARQMRATGEATGAFVGVQITGGSSSVRDAYEPLRLAGACARAMLVRAAAGRWNVSAQECWTAGGAVLHHNGQRLAYGVLAEEAARLGVPNEVRPKAPAERRLVGTRAPRRDIPDKVAGKAMYGADLRLPGMRFAAVRGCPLPGGSLARLDAELAKSMNGVQAVVSYEGAAGCAPGVGVVADNSWQAQLAASACKLEWAAGKTAPFSSDTLMGAMHAALDGADDGFIFHKRGDGIAALGTVAKVLYVEYRAPWLAHATMEPMNCTAQWIARGSNGAREHLRLWVPTQTPTLARDTAARVAGLDKDQITLEVTELGGGFGRRLESDFLVPAIALARAASPAPVQVQWSREEDMTHDFYRPAAVCRLQAGIDAQGRLVAIAGKTVSDAVTPQFLGRNFPLMATSMAPVPDRTQAEGLWDQAYEIPHRQFAHIHQATPVPIGNWRSVGHSHMAFFLETFIDELAHAAGTDALEFRRALLVQHPRQRAVLELAASKAGWGQRLPAGRARGIALHESFGTIVAQVAEVSLEAGRPRVHRVVCALDCGTVIQPDIVAQQMESSVIFALSAALYGRISFKDGRVEQSNFPDYDMVRLREAPLVETCIVASEAAPTGVGEPATPPLAPAVGNALFALTGKRLRELPFRLS